jgi:hypothetical protein
MGKQTIGIYRNPWRDTNGVPSLRTPIDIYRHGIFVKANPRDEAYMRALFAERHPQGTFVRVDNEPDWQRKTTEADEVVLLYPDAIGVGYTRIESKLRGLRGSWASVSVLNGRKREFAFAPMRRGLRVRRFAERWMIAEWAIMFCFVVATPALLVFDWVRGRR